MELALENGAILKSSGSQFAWKQRLIGKAVRSLLDNAFHCRWEFESLHRVNASANFISLYNYLSSLNRVQSTLYLMVEALLKLLSHTNFFHYNTPSRWWNHHRSGRWKLYTKNLVRERRHMKLFNSKNRFFDLFGNGWARSGTSAGVVLLFSEIKHI